MTWSTVTNHWDQQRSIANIQATHLKDHRRCMSEAEGQSQPNQASPERIEDHRSQKMIIGVKKKIPDHWSTMIIGAEFNQKGKGMRMRVRTANFRGGRRGCGSGGQLQFAKDIASYGIVWSEKRNSARERIGKPTVAAARVRDRFGKKKENVGWAREK